MSNIDVVNVGGVDYDIADATAQANALTAMTIAAYRETGNTASQAYSVVGTPINWKGTLYYTKTAVAKGATWAVDTNLVAAKNLGSLMSNIKTYVNDDGDLVFRDLRGADTVLPFKGSIPKLSMSTTAGSVNSYGAASSNAKLPILDSAHNKLSYSGYVITALEDTSIFITFILGGTNHRNVNYWYNGTSIASWGNNSTYSGVDDSRLLNLNKGDTFYITDYNHGDGYSPSFSCRIIYMD